MMPDHGADDRRIDVGKPAHRHRRRRHERGSRGRPEPPAPGPRAGASLRKATRRPPRLRRYPYRRRYRRRGAPVVRGRRGPRALLYSGRPRPQRAAPANQEVRDRAWKALRPPREAAERPTDGDPPRASAARRGRCLSRSRALTVRGLFLIASRRPPAGGAPDAGHRDRRAPVGRRGQGQDDRLPGRAGRDGRPLPGRRQRRPHGGQRRRGLQAPPDAVGRAVPAHHLGHRQRRRGQPGHAHRRARHARLAGHRRQPRPGQPQRARDHAVPHRPRPGQRGAPGRREGRARPDAASGRPTPTAPGDSACAWRTCSTRRCCASGSVASCPTRTCSCASMGAEPFEVDALVERGRRLGRTAPLASRRHDLARPGGAGDAASTCSSRARRARCSTSTTAATRS